MVSQYIMPILFFLWLIHIIRRVFYCVYFWQLKDYRIDRMKADLKTTVSVFLPKTAIIAFVFLLLSPIFLSAKNISLWNNSILVIFYLLGFYSLFLFSGKKWKAPKTTKKSAFLLILSIAALLYGAFIFVSNFFVFIVATEIILSFAIFLVTEIIQIPVFFVKIAIYARAKNKIKKHKGLIVIGVTGSYGKSSTKEFLYAFLSKKYKVLKTSGNNNTEIGVAQTVVKKLKPEHQIFIAEMGAYRKGEIGLLCDIVKPKIGLVTGVNEQHLSLFGSMENLLSAEGGWELANALPRPGEPGYPGILVVNGDNKYCLELYKNSEGIKRKVYSLSNKTIDSDIWVEDAEAGKDYVSFVAMNKNREMGPFKVNVLGKQNIQNLLGAILTARELGVSFGEIFEACKSIKPEQAGMVLKQGKHGINIIDSSYSANPDGVLADLDYLSIFTGKKVIVMPCLIELGEKSAEIHEKIGRKIGEICDFAIITGKDKFKEIKKGALEAGMPEKNILLCNKAQEIFSMVTLFCKSGDDVLLEGRVPSGLTKLLF